MLEKIRPEGATRMDFKPGDRVSWQAHHIEKRLYGDFVARVGDKIVVHTIGGATLEIEAARIVKESH
jgi:hypothetical protein